MAISKTGNILENAADGLLSVGHSAAGNLTVNGGSVLNLDDPDNSAEPILIFGRQTTGVGTGLITGAGSTVNVIASGRTDLDTGAGVVIGRDGDGDLTVSAGGKLSIVDLLGPAGSQAFGSEEFLQIGRNGAGASGNLLVDAGTVELIGTGAIVNIGRDGATGTATFRNGSTFHVESRTEGDGAVVRVGRNGGTGTLVIDNSTATIESPTFAVFQIGRDPGDGSPDNSTGTLTLRNNASLTLTGAGTGVAFGNGVGTDATVLIESGADFIANDTDLSNGPGALGMAQFASSTANVTVTGAGSTLNTNGGIGIGAAGGGQATVNVLSGGQILARGILLSDGGTLRGDGTVTTTNGFGLNGGKIQLESELGPLKLQSGVNVTSGTINVEVSADATANGRLDVTGGIVFQGGEIVIDPLGGHKFAANKSFTFLSATGGILAFDPFTLAATANFTVKGQHADFGYLVIYDDAATDTLSFRALTSGATGGNAVLDFGAASTIGATFFYDTSLKKGGGTGGIFDGVYAVNLDLIRGTAGGDTLNLTGSGRINVDARDGDDTVNGSSGVDNIKGGAGNDILNGGNGADFLDGGLGADTMAGGAGNDRYFVDDSGDTVIEATSGGGTDTLYTSVSYTLAESTPSNQVAVEYIRANYVGATGITITGNNVANVIFGGAGADTLNGGGGNDRLDGGVGADTLTGGLGTDSYYVDNAGDVVVETGNEGVDTVYASVSWTLAETAPGGAPLTVETLRAFYNGNTGITLTGNSQRNFIYGDTGGDTLDGGGNGDTIFGGAGNDTIIGGLGRDQMFGQLGADTFVFRSAAESPTGANDFIKDFSGIGGQLDKIDLQAVFGGTLEFIGSAAFDGNGGEVRVVHAGGISTVEVDVDGGGRDLVISVTTANALVQNDFLL